jgi:hypothetical protein
MAAVRYLTLYHEGMYLEYVVVDVTLHKDYLNVAGPSE